MPPLVTSSSRSSGRRPPMRAGLAQLQTSLTGRFRRGVSALYLGVRVHLASLDNAKIGAEKKRYPVGRPDFKPGREALCVSGGFDSHSFPPDLTWRCAHSGAPGGKAQYLLQTRRWRTETAHGLLNGESLTLAARAGRRSDPTAGRGDIAEREQMVAANLRLFTRAA